MLLQAQYEAVPDSQLGVSVRVGRRTSFHSCQHIAWPFVCKAHAEFCLFVLVCGLFSARPLLLALPLAGQRGVDAP